MGDLLLALASDEVLEEVDGEVVATAEVGLHVDGEEDEDLSLGAELGAEAGGGDGACLGIVALHGG